MSTSAGNQPRQPKGVPTGGQWKPQARPEGSTLGGAGAPVAHCAVCGRGPEVPCLKPPGCPRPKLVVRCVFCGKGPEAGHIEIHAPASGPQYHDRCLAAKMAEDEAKMIDSLVAAGAVPCFARYGAPPSTMRSANRADGTTEAGVSVFRAWLSTDGTVWYAASDSYSAHLFGSRRPAWVVEGAKVVGTGSDGEPLVRGGKWRRVGTMEPII